MPGPQWLFQHTLLDTLTVFCNRDKDVSMGPSVQHFLTSPGGCVGRSGVSLWVLEEEPNLNTVTVEWLVV